MSGLSTHVLDLVRGTAAAGINVTAFKDYIELARSTTNDDGRVSNCLGDQALQAGRYRLVFEVGEYLRKTRGAGDAPAFYESIPIDFVIADPGAKYHVPLLLSPYGYSTYRGT